MNQFKRITLGLTIFLSCKCFSQDIPYGNNPAAGHYINIDGTKIYYEIYGKGKPLVMLHGGVYGYIDEFSPFIPKLAENFQVICIATRGHGKSEMGKDPFTYKQRADDAYKVIRSITKVAVAHIPVPVPGNDIESTSPYAYNWPTVLEDTKGHKSHLIVSIMSGTTDQIKRFKVFTEVVCSLLRITNSIGVYEGNQSLLIPKEDFLDESKFMSQEYLPLNLWIYFGLRRNTTGNSTYTYGLKEFGKIEMEILNSTKNLEEIRGFIFNITHYVLDHDVTFHDGETCGVSEEEKIAITLSKGEFVEGDTFKLVY